MSDPWQENSASISSKNNFKRQNQFDLKFEDNFANPERNELTPLPDSADYIQVLERKLQKLKKNSNLIEALHEKRNDCMRNLLQESENRNNTNEIFELEAPINNGETSAVHEIFRHIQPVQPVKVGETVRILTYDQLDTAATAKAKKNN